MATFFSFRERSSLREYWDYKYGFTKVAEVYSIQGSRAKIVFEEGSCVKVQELRRRWYNSPEPPEDLQWDDLGAKSVQVMSDMSSGWFENGEHATILLRIKYYYERWKYYYVDPTAGIIMYEEWVIPDKALGPVSYTNGVKTCHCGAVSGNAYIIGNQEGVYRSFQLAGTDGYYWSPAVTVGFTVSYPTKEVTLGVQIKAERHYAGAVKIYVEVTEDRSLWLWGRNFRL
ncbi:MAG: hypothetical protein J7J99_06815 [Thermoprotei archaeon]|nr:hypothetical protein [Thermoprotei archaeon]